MICRNILRKTAKNSHPFNLGGFICWVGSQKMSKMIDSLGFAYFLWNQRTIFLLKLFHTHAPGLSIPCISYMEVKNLGFEVCQYFSTAKHTCDQYFVLFYLSLTPLPLPSVYLHGEGLKMPREYKPDPHNYPHKTGLKLLVCVFGLSAPAVCLFFTTIARHANLETGVKLCRKVNCDFVVR